MQDKELYDYLSSFIVLGENNRRFVDSLSKEYRWNKSFAQKAYKEYLRFIYLIAMTETPLTPSLQIDKVWKFHMGYSESYWHKLCETIIKKPLHRNFSSNFNKGIEKEFFIDLHQRYYEEFNEKPSMLIWGVSNNRYINNFINNTLFLWSKKYCISTTLLFFGLLFYIIKN